MTRFKNKYRIESNRFRYWDYSSPGYYFITICTQDRECFLGRIENATMILSQYGTIVKNEFLQITTYHKYIELGEWVIMPNHVHMIIEIMDPLGEEGDTNENDKIDDSDVETIHELSLQSQSRQQPWWHNPNHTPTIDDIKQYRKHRRQMMIPKIIGKFKMRTSKQINQIRNTPAQSNWQSNYHDHIIRNHRSYQNISNYIINNPIKWQNDTFNPKHS